MAASLAQQIGGLRYPTSSLFITKKQSFSTTQNVRRVIKGQAANISVIATPQTKERQKLKDLFEEAYERCRTSPYDGVAFTVADFHSAIEKFDYNSEIGSKNCSQEIVFQSAYFVKSAMKYLEKTTF
ncbi:hypothetical protein Tco_0067981 [Tanacetum coccineum]